MSQENSDIRTCAFQHMRATVGGAILINDTNFVVNLVSCYFCDCNATGFRRSTARDEDNPSGGACHFDVKQINVSNIYSTRCHSNYYGHSMYFSLPHGQKYYTNCFSDTFSGKEASPYSSVVVFDAGNAVVNDINITYPKDINYAGSFIFASYPTASSLKYSNVVFSNDYRSTAIGLSLKEGCSNEIDFVHIQNAAGDSTKGIFTIWNGNNNLNHIYLDECSGILDKIMLTIQSLTIRNSYLGKNVEVCSAQIENQITDIESFPFPRLTQCNFYIGIYKTCVKWTKFTFLSFHITLFLLSLSLSE